MPNMDPIVELDLLVFCVSPRPGGAISLFELDSLLLECESPVLKLALDLRRRLVRNEGISAVHALRKDQRLHGGVAARRGW